MTKQGYTISQMSEISKISKKALRFYDDLGLISCKRHGGNNYRYYTQDELLAIPPLKYYKQMERKQEKPEQTFGGNDSRPHPHQERTGNGKSDRSVRTCIGWW